MAFTSLDHCISGASVTKVKSSESHGKALQDLIDNILAQNSDVIHKYVYSTFMCFVQSKRRIDICLDYLENLWRMREY